MPRPQTSPAPATSLWPTLFAVALISAALGAFGMWTWIQAHPAASAATAPAAASANAPETHEPPPELTAGLTPALAARARGDFFYDHGNWTRAVTEYRGAIVFGSDDANLRTDLANALQFSGQAAAAVLEYQKAQQLDPGHEASLFNLGVCYSDTLGDPVQALATWQLFLERFPQSAKAADARRLIAQLQAAPAGHPAPAGSTAAAPNPAAPGTPASPPADADVQALMKFVKPAPPAAPEKK